MTENHRLQKKVDNSLLERVRGPNNQKSKNTEISQQFQLKASPVSIIQSQRRQKKVVNFHLERVRASNNYKSRLQKKLTFPYLSELSVLI